jgi:hypothetical protein
VHFRVLVAFLCSREFVFLRTCEQCGLAWYDTGVPIAATCLDRGEPVLFKLSDVGALWVGQSGAGDYVPTRGLFMARRVLPLPILLLMSSLFFVCAGGEAMLRGEEAAYSRIGG